MNNDQNDLYGLVLIGGQSRRMRQDKASLSFHGKEQYLYCYELLAQFCSEVYLSIREEQREQYEHSGCNLIIDHKDYLDKGPLAGIVTALDAYPGRSFLVLACDLPNVNEDVIQTLINGRTGHTATAFKSTSNGLPEPLCAIYESQGLVTLKENLNQGLLCPRKILINAGIPMLGQKNQGALNNINNPQELDDFLKQKR